MNLSDYVCKGRCQWDYIFPELMRLIKEIIVILCGVGIEFVILGTKLEDLYPISF